MGACEEGCERVEEEEGCGGGGGRGNAEGCEEYGGEIGWIQHHVKKKLWRLKFENWLNMSWNGRL